MDNKINAWLEDIERCISCLLWGSCGSLFHCIYSYHSVLLAMWALFGIEAVRRRIRFAFVSTLGGAAEFLLADLSSGVNCKAKLRCVLGL